MATSLTPAYIRIAGPSTARMSFRNTSIAIEDPQPRRLTLSQMHSEENGTPYDELMNLLRLFSFVQSFQPSDKGLCNDFHPIRSCANCRYPTTFHDSFNVVRPSNWRSANAALSRAGSSTLGPHRPLVLRATCPCHSSFVLTITLVTVCCRDPSDENGWPPCISITC